ncbi:hypothetical protein SDC9_210338 [bioreactor metagenome]|uniref:Uncharacterized protein n=1 Tax=bioreactor metagenome TaxID=1076179 RepID=A0A645JGW2_9ZZZZ
MVLTSLYLSFPRMASRTWKPSMTGMFRSRIIRSTPGFPSRMSIACLPSAAVRVLYSPSMPRMMALSVAESSTISMVSARVSSIMCHLSRFQAQCRIFPSAAHSAGCQRHPAARRSHLFSLLQAPFAVWRRFGTAPWRRCCPNCS